MENATVSEIPATLENGSTLTFTVTPNEKYIIEFVKANGAKIEAQDGQYSVIVRGNIEIEISIVLEGTTVDKDVKIDFSTKDQRLSLDNNSQVWANDGVTFTNNKDKSTTNVADYSNPIRLYKSSTVVIDATGIKSITINCNTASYAAALKASTFSAGTVTINDKVVTITFDEPVDSLTISALSAQVRIDSIVVTIAG